MVFTAEETLQIENMKFQYKTKFEELRHKNRLEELRLELEIAKCGVKVSSEVIDEED